MALLEAPESIVDSFYNSLKTEMTKSLYHFGNEQVLGDRQKQAEFLVLVDSNRWKAQEKLISWINDNKHRGEYAVRHYLTPVKSLVEYAELEIKWKKVMRALPPLPPPKDKAPPADAIKKIYDQADLRFRAIIHIFLAAPRVGAFDYFIRGDLQERKIGNSTIGVLMVYHGEPEEYVSFVTDEGLSSIYKYLAFRAEMGEEINAKSPLVRTVFNPFPKMGQHSSVKKLSSGSVKALFFDAWNRAGYPVGTRNWKMTHCFRKFLKTALEDTPMKTNYIELIEGHSLKLQGHYQKTEVEKLAAAFVQYMDRLYITEEFRSRKKVVEVQKEFEEKENKWYVQAKKSEAELADMKLAFKLKRRYDSLPVGSPERDEVGEELDKVEARL